MILYWFLGLLLLFINFPEGYQNIDNSKFFVCRGKGLGDNYYVTKNYNMDEISNDTVNTFIEINNLKDIDTIYDSPICEEPIETNDDNEYKLSFQKILEHDTNESKSINIENEIKNKDPPMYKHYNDPDTILYSETIQNKILENKLFINGGDVDDRNYTVGHGYVDKSNTLLI